LLLCLFAVLIGVRLCGFVGMHPRLALVTCSGVSVVSGLLVLASLMLFGSLIMMLGGFAAVDRCLFMVFRSFLGHVGSSLGVRPTGGLDSPRTVVTGLRSQSNCRNDNR
jgi:hypothetical protein